MALPDQNIFTDLDATFTKHPVTSDIGRLTNVDAIKRSVKNLLLTKRFERPFEPDVSSRIAGLLFEPLGATTELAIQKEIYNALETFEPRIVVDDVLVNANSQEDGYNVGIVFSIVNSFERLEIEFFLSRIN